MERVAADALADDFEAELAPAPVDIGPLRGALRRPGASFLNCSALITENESEEEVNRLRATFKISFKMKAKK